MVSSEPGQKEKVRKLLAMCVYPYVMCLCMTCMHECEAAHWATYAGDN